MGTNIQPIAESLLGRALTKEDGINSCDIEQAEKRIGRQHLPA